MFIDEWYILEAWQREPDSVVNSCIASLRTATRSYDTYGHWLLARGLASKGR